MAQEQWRFIPCASFDGARNMAIDEAILQSYLAGAVPPTLRLYLFNPPAVTIGLSQKMAPDVVACINEQGIDVVRRPTGGRAVLHLNDLTYSFVGGDTSMPGGFLSTGITASYKEICAGLMAAFSLLKVDSELGEAQTAYRHLQDCFQATTGCDLHHRGVKLIGSAQMRRRGAVLQHGSVPLNQDPLLMAKLLGEGQQPGARHRNLFEITAEDVPQARLEAAFKEGFERAFGVELKPGTLTERELQHAEQLPVKVDRALSFQR